MVWSEMLMLQTLLWNPRARRSYRTSPCYAVPTDEWALPITSWLRVRSWGMSRVPIAPLAPITNTRIANPPSWDSGDVGRSRTSSWHRWQSEPAQAIRIRQHIDLHDLTAHDRKRHDGKRPAIRKP